MKVLVITPYYIPDLGPSAPMISLLCESLAMRGYDVTVLATVPHFPSGSVATEYRQELWQWEEMNGVRVCRIRVPSGNRMNLWHRVLTLFVYQLLATVAGLRLSYDATFITNPAIETGIPFAVLSWLRRKPCIFGVWDLYPEIGQQLGIFRHRAIIAVVKALEDFCLQKATAVQALSEDFIENLSARVSCSKKIVVIPIWIDTDFIRPLPRKNRFSAVHDLNDVFVVLYAGNLGFSQGLDVFLLAAKRLLSQSHIRFVFVGDGPNREALVQQAEVMKLSNVQFIPFQPRERLPEVLGTADVSLVSLQKGVGHFSLPSKTFSILASGRPLLVSADANTSIVRLVETANIGMVVDPENHQALSEAILFLSKSPKICREYGSNGRAYVENNHSYSVAVSKFNNLFWSVIKEVKIK